MKYIEFSFILSYVLAACLVVANSNGHNDYHRFSKVLARNHPDIGVSCIRGVAFTITNNTTKALEYRQYHGKCMDKLIAQYKQTIIL